MESILNNILVRIVISVFVGIPLTALALIGGAHGFILGYAGIINAKFGLILIGIVTITGFIGLSGAWRRLLVPSSSMTDKARNRTRAMLFFGLASSLALSLWAITSDGLTIISLPLILLSVGGVIFILATPKSLSQLGADAAPPG